MLSIVIVNWNTKALLEKCLASLQRHAPSESYEVIVVDNASSDGSADMIRDRFPQVRLLAQAENRGYAEGNNIGIRAATGEFVLLLNPDTEFIDDSLQRSVDILRSMPSVGALAARLINPDGSTQPSLRSFPRPLPVLFDLFGVARLLPRSRFFGRYRYRFFDYDSPAEVEQPMGTFLLTRREVFDQVGLLDEAFPIFFNDVDWCLRVRNAGWRVYYHPDVRVVHHGGAGTRQVRKSMIWESHRSLLRFYDKWYARWWNLPLLWLFRLVVLAAAFLRTGGVHAGYRP
ncbi:MAG: glycosyltransferase family 2 protein [Armatimonadota bacterium]